MCLNPCCRGIWPRCYQNAQLVLGHVLILVVVEYGLGGFSPCSVCDRKVLILVVVEYGLGALLPWIGVIYLSLNPCCRGIWSRRIQKIKLKVVVVLILVVVEYGLGAIND